MENNSIKSSTYMTLKMDTILTILTYYIMILVYHIKKECMYIHSFFICKWRRPDHEN